MPLSTKQIERLQNQITEFENKYNIPSDKFMVEYGTGNLGDEIEYMEWAATIEMLENAVNKSKNLSIEFQ